jgi:hypothetical protein
MLQVLFLREDYPPWNNLPNYVLEGDVNLSKFKSRLKKYMNIY